MSDRLTFHRVPHDYILLSMCEWLRKHGIDPDYVLLPGWVERDEQARRVWYLTFAWDDEERCTALRDDETKEFLTRAEYVQLEAHPLPWPSEVLDLIIPILEPAGG